MTDLRSLQIEMPENEVRSLIAVVFDGLKRNKLFPRVCCNEKLSLQEVIKDCRFLLVHSILFRLELLSEFLIKAAECQDYVFIGWSQQSIGSVKLISYLLSLKRISTVAFIRTRSGFVKV